MQPTTNPIKYNLLANVHTVTRLACTLLLYAVTSLGNYKEWSSYVNRSAVGWILHIRKWLDSQLSPRATLLVVKFENLLIDLRAELTKMMKYLDILIQQKIYIVVLDSLM